MELQPAVNNIFIQLTDSITRLSEEQYARPCKNLTNNTIGQHVRHIIELFQCLDKGYATGTVDYEKRKRDTDIENDKSFACDLLHQIFQNLNKPNKELLLAATYDDHSTEPVIISTNYYREIAYNLEHTIHHMALMRVGISEVSDIVLSEDFGVASSTIKHRRQCAQ
ncbi:MAG: DinB family protein [Bacteroidetes bacterium]|nr:DinB family protein [Bacteroidota bacterium]